MSLGSSGLFCPFLRAPACASKFGMHPVIRGAPTRASHRVRPIARYAFEFRLFDFFGGIVRCGFRSNLPMPATP